MSDGQTSNSQQVMKEREGEQRVERGNTGEEREIMKFSINITDVLINGTDIDMTDHGRITRMTSCSHYSFFLIQLLGSQC